MYKTNSQKKLSLIVFGIYMFLLTWLILFKFAVNLNDLSHIRNINLMPFSASMIVNGKLEVREIIYNLLVFVPLGVYIGIFKSKWSFIKKIVPCLGLSLLFEILQFVFAIGASDITDLIGNTLGGIIGIIMYSVFKQIFKDKLITIVNSMGLIIEVFAIIMLGILLSVNS